MASIPFSPGWKLSLFTALLMPLLLWLGVWQLDREQEKVAMQVHHAARSAAPAVAVQAVDWQSEDLAYVRIVAEGRYDNERSYLLDNRIFRGRAGYEILTPFSTIDGHHLLINRGWIQAGSTRDDLPQVEVVDGQVQITGSIYVPVEEPFLLSDVQEAHGAGWPRVIQSIRMDEIAAQLGLPMLAHSVRLTAGSPGLEQDNWPTVNMQPEKHRAYAVQWFTMATALLVMYVYFGFKHPASRRNREET